jgi:NAD(P)-binding Rossmann-like domain/Flavin containing amine oxidoreductase
MGRQSGGPSIVIIGAGPAGLSTAYFLRKRGYQNVLVLERLGRVGGLCDSLTCGERSFDLGANYVTPAYKEVLRLAEEYGAEVYSERPMIAMSVPEDAKGRVRYQSMFDAVRIDDRTGKRIGILEFFWLLLRYVWLRWRLSGVIDRPTFAGVEEHPELARPMQEWLDGNGLTGLTRVLQLPSTMMGYGVMSETPAIYILKFLSIGTFVPMALKETPIIGKFTGWPKRFTQGFQRLWERVAWDLQVRTGVNVIKVKRQPGERIVVHFESGEQELAEYAQRKGELECDHLIVACPQPVLLGMVELRPSTQPEKPSDFVKSSAFLDLTTEEVHLFGQIKEVWYCMTTFHVENLSVDGQSPLAAIYPLAPLLKPRGVAKQWPECELVQFYSPISPYDIERVLEETRRKVREGYPELAEYLVDLERVYQQMTNRQSGEGDCVRDVVIKYVKELVGQMGGTIRADNTAWHTYNRFTYFQHVEPAAILGGFYTELEHLQGRNNTYFVGGATNFELVEPTVQYARHLVETHFPPVS